MSLIPLYVQVLTIIVFINLSQILPCIPIQLTYLQITVSICYPYFRLSYQSLKVC